MSQSSVIDNEVSLDAVYKELSHWKSHKKEYPNRGIPDATWKKIFQLEAQGYTKTELRQFFSLNSGQYDVKHAQFFSEKKTASTNNTATKLEEKPDSQAQHNDAIVFCEVVEAQQSQSNEVPSLTLDNKARPNKTKREISQLRSNDNSPEQFLDLTTIIVECIRPDGHRLKIHTTTKSLDVVMQTFYKSGVIAE